MKNIRIRLIVFWSLYLMASIALMIGFMIIFGALMMWDTFIHTISFNLDAIGNVLGYNVVLTIAAGMAVPVLYRPLEDGQVNIRTLKEAVLIVIGKSKEEIQNEQLHQ